MYAEANVREIYLNYQMDGGFGGVSAFLFKVAFSKFLLLLVLKGMHALCDVNLALFSLGNSVLSCLLTKLFYVKQKKQNIFFFSRLAAQKGVQH